MLSNNNNKNMRCPKQIKVSDESNKYVKFTWFYAENNLHLFILVERIMLFVDLDVLLEFFQLFLELGSGLVIYILEHFQRTGILCFLWLSDAFHDLTKKRTFLYFNHLKLKLKKYLKLTRFLCSASRIPSVSLLMMFLLSR